MERKNRSARCSDAATEFRRSTPTNSGGNTRLAQCVFNKLRQPAFYSNTRSQFLFQRRAPARQVVERLASLGHRAILFLAVGLGAEPHKRCRPAALRSSGQILCPAPRQGSAGLGSTLPPTAENVSPGGLVQPRPASGIPAPSRALAGITQQHRRGRLSIVTLQQQFHVLPHIARRNTGRIFRKHRRSSCWFPAIQPRTCGPAGRRAIPPACPPHSSCLPAPLESCADSSVCRLISSSSCRTAFTFNSPVSNRSSA